MKYQLTLIFLFSFLCGYNQENIYSKFENELCDCIEKNSSANLFSSPVFTNCLDEILTRNADELVNAAAEKYGDPNGKMDTFTKFFIDSVQVDLVYKCTIYFNKMDSSRYTFGIQKDKNTLQRMLADYKAHPSSTAVYFFNRAEIYFQLGDYKNALVDINKSIQYDSSKAESYITKGLLLEKQSQFEQAIIQYNRALGAYTKNKNDEGYNSLRMFIAVATRKLKEAR